MLPVACGEDSREAPLAPPTPPRTITGSPGAHWPDDAASVPLHDALRRGTRPGLIGQVALGDALRAWGRLTGIPADRLQRPSGFTLGTPGWPFPHCGRPRLAAAGTIRLTGQGVTGQTADAWKCWRRWQLWLLQVPGPPHPHGGRPVPSAREASAQTYTALASSLNYGLPGGGRHCLSRMPGSFTSLTVAWSLSKTISFAQAVTGHTTRGRGPGSKTGSAGLLTPP